MAKASLLLPNLLALLHCFAGIDHAGCYWMTTCKLVITCHLPKGKEFSTACQHSPSAIFTLLTACTLPCRADRFAMLHAGIGRASFPAEHLLANFTALASALMSVRPKGVKGSGVSGYILSVQLSSTMGPCLPVTMASTIAALQQGSAPRKG